LQKRRPLDLKGPELQRHRLAIARSDTPETRAAYWLAIAAHARREADRLEREAKELLSGQTEHDNR
jgi:hypothetical protein